MRDNDKHQDQNECYICGDGEEIEICEGKQRASTLPGMFYFHPLIHFTSIY